MKNGILCRRLAFHDAVSMYLQVFDRRSLVGSQQSSVVLASTVMSASEGSRCKYFNRVFIAGTLLTKQIQPNSFSRKIFIWKMFSRKTYIAQLNHSWTFDRGANCFYLCFSEVRQAPHYNLAVFVSKFFTRLRCNLGSYRQKWL